MSLSSGLRSWYREARASEPRALGESYPGNNRLRVPVLVATCILLGLLMGIFYMGMDLQDHPDRSDRLNAQIFSVHIGAAIVAWCLAPAALRHVRREVEGDGNYPGTRGTFVAALAIMVTSWSFLTPPLVIVVMVSVFARRSVVWSLSVIGGAAVGVASEFLARREFLDAHIDGEEVSYTVLGLTMLVIVALIAGIVRGYQREGAWKAVFRAQQEAENARTELLSVRQEERDRLARDIHDSLSHRLSLISMHSGALAADEGALSPELRQRAADTVRMEAAAAVEDLRSVLDVLRSGESMEPQMGVGELVERARDAGEDVSLQFEQGTQDADLGHLPTVAAHALSRAVQEGLTNARKHAPGQPVTIKVGRDRGMLRLTMSNPQPDIPTDAQGARHGLMGLAERARIVGGDFTLHATDMNFSWTIKVPLTAKDKA